jgi:Cation transporting ATPase, C-terminus
VTLSLFSHVLVVYVPVLQSAFHTVALSAFDWTVATVVSATLLLIVEAAKLGFRFRGQTLRV